MQGVSASNDSLGSGDIRRARGGAARILDTDGHNPVTKEGLQYTDVEGRKASDGERRRDMMQYPAFGLGIDNFARAECTISPKLAYHRFGVHCAAPRRTTRISGQERSWKFPDCWFGVLSWLGGIFAPLRLRRRLPKSWRRGTPSERLIYGATSFFPVAMVGFAVPSFFVSFAWMDTIYFLAALLTGLYVAAQVQFHESGLGRGAQPAQLVPAGRVPGWRVRQSAWRSLIEPEGARAR